MIKKIILSSILAFASLGAVAEIGVLEFSYDNSGTWGYWGTGKKENYDLAIRIKSPTFVGKEITSISLPVRPDTRAANYKIWLSKELTLEKKGSVKVTVPDVMTQDVTHQNGYITLDLATPYTITEDGIYVGYSFELSQIGTATLPVADQAPCRLSIGSDPDGMYIHSTRSYLKWMPIGDQYNAAVPFSVKIKGDYPQNCVEITNIDEMYGQIGADMTASVYLLNLGTKPVTSIDYTYKIKKEEGQGHYDFTSALQPNFTRRNAVALPISTTLPEGNYGLEIKVTKVNGQDNEFPDPVAYSQIILKNTVPIHRAVIEEYTGLWCGFCPTGYVALAKMNRLFPDKFIGLSYHKGDEMQIMDSKEFPVILDGYPEAWVDRTEQVNPYFGKEQNVFGLDKVWQEYCDKFPLAAISAYAGWSSDKKTIEVDATAKFVKDLNEGEDAYRFAYYLVGNGLEDDSWRQNNNYRNNGAYYMDQDMKPFTDGGSEIAGLVYDDVVIQCENVRGLPNTIPSAIVKDAPINHHYAFNTEETVNSLGDSMFDWADPAKVEVVVLVIEKRTNQIVNATKVHVNDQYVLIKDVNTDANAHEVARYSIDGKRINGNTPGLNIIQYSDGSVRKVIVK